ncbi:hypothetical protein DSO57_1000243 [Entomophthora muscae]|uniref:Uncharacterized protein n=1 Tax=Entomophthora muscae TaxID=34485 RepID=A0ACC2SY74_9FUNG|nr:hypothetical protein DSO57_1000243 [Entomophthora muscae]
MSIQLPPLKSNACAKPISLPPLSLLMKSINLSSNIPKVKPAPVKPPKHFSINIINHSFQKRPRRRYSEVTRIYPCIHPGCTKAYGALNHLNAHIQALGHGSRRCTKDFPISKP